MLSKLIQGHTANKGQGKHGNLICKAKVFSPLPLVSPRAGGHNDGTHAGQVSSWICFGGLYSGRQKGHLPEG